MPHFADRLVDRARHYASRVIVGLDPDLDHFPLILKRELGKSPQPGALEETLYQYLVTIIDATRDIAVAYKPQAAFFECFGLEGMSALQRTLEHLRQNECLIILDGKRNDVAHTARAYANAWLAAKRPLFGTPNPWRSDAMTVNGYLGSDGIRPFLDADPDAGLFVLAKTSNPSSGELQDLTLAGSGETVCHRMAGLVTQWGANWRGVSGYSRVGMVVGATYPETAAQLRRLAPQALFLMPGIGPQAGSVAAIRAGAGADGLGAYAAVSRNILYPCTPEELDRPDWRNRLTRAASEAARGMKELIRSTLGHD
ncbi:MAG: orotidine-5'-phosphate decarboxylase [Magnetococcales bacterium]|nr:orotidine-5'-phosphate decarboxylase [Magnetococcales bacterium]